MSIEAMKQWLGAIERANEIDGLFSWQNEENSLRQAIEEAEKQEPVAWRRSFEGDVSDLCQWLYADEYEPKDDNPNWKPLYTNPPKREPLIWDEIYEAFMQSDMEGTFQREELESFARAIEAAHGIKGEA